MRRSLPLVSVLAFSSCTYLTEPERRSLPLDYRAVPHEQVADFSAVGGDGTIVVRDRYITGVCHEEETQTATRSQSTITLRIDHPEDVPPGSVCIDLGQVGAFEATIGGLEAGTYRLRLDYDGDVQSETRPPAPTEATVTVK